MTGKALIINELLIVYSNEFCGYPRFSCKHQTMFETVRGNIITTIHNTL
jgi:hypothetical protein